MSIQWTTYNIDFDDSPVDQRGWHNPLPYVAGTGRTSRAALADLASRLGCAPSDLTETTLGPEPDRDINTVPGAGGNGDNLRIVAYVWEDVTA